MRDPYLRASGILRNVPGTDDPKALRKVEARLAGSRLARLAHGEGPALTGDCLNDLKAIHSFIFERVYPWAGTTRAEPFRDIVEGSRKTIATDFISIRDGNVFVTPREIAARLDGLSKKIKSANGFKMMKQRDFVIGIADALADINEIHAFREGNGRAQRSYISRLVQEAGRTIDFRVITKERMAQASIAAHDGDPWPMRRLIRDVTSPERVKELLKVMAFLTKVSLSDEDFDPNERYVGFVEPGKQHTAEIVGLSGRHFACIQNNSSILVGWRKDLPTGSHTPGHIVTFVGSGAPTNAVARRTSEFDR